MRTDSAELEAFLSDELADICARAYDVFSVPVPARAGICTACCMYPEDERRMRATPVREIPLALVQEWLGAAFSPDPGQPQMLWLLPRILELLARGQDVCDYGNEVALRRCGQGGSVDRWPHDRRALIEEFAAAYVDARLDLRRPQLDEAFCMLSLDGIDPAPVLARLEQVPPPRLAHAMAADWGAAFPHLGRNAFWVKGPFLDAVRDWFCDGRLGDRLTAWGIAHPDDAPEEIWTAAESVSRRR